MAQELSDGMVLGMGNPLLDITASVDSTFLEKYDMKPNNAILAEEKHKSMYEEMILNFKVDYTAGGAVQNTLRVTQWVLKRPNVTTFMGCVGRDKYSKILEDNAKNEGVNVRYQFTESEPTGTCAVLITDSGRQRSLCANLAAANHFTIDHIHIPENKNLIESAMYYYISGFFLTVSPVSMLEVAKLALKSNKTFMINLSAPFLIQFFKEPMMQIFPYVDILFGNETEAATFAKEHDFGTEDMKEIVLKISMMPKLNTDRSRLVVITQGQAPVLVAQDGTVKEYPAVQLPSAKVIDTNGAGDAFVGGFLAQLVLGKPLETCVCCGIWTATEVIQHSGCTFDRSLSFPG